MRALKIVIAFLLAVLVVSIAIYFIRPDSTARVDLTIDTPANARLGQPFPIQITFGNFSEQSVVDAKLALTLPAGISVLGKSPDLRVYEQAIGTVSPSGRDTIRVNLIATSGNQTIKHLEAKLLYGTDVNPKVVFESSAEADVSIGDAAVTVSFETPEKVFSGEQFSLKVRYENNSEMDFAALRLKLDYPPQFQFAESTMKPSRGNNVWDLGKLPRGAYGDFTITGKATGPEQSFFGIRGTLYADLSGQTYAITAQDASFAISQSPLSVGITVNRSGAEYVAKPGELIDYALTYRNNAAVTLENITITATFIGEMFDFTKVKSDAFLNSVANTATWSAANTPGLARVGPGESGVVNLQIGVKDAYPIRRSSDKNYMLKMKVQIESPTVPDATGAAKTVSLAGIENKVAGRLLTTAKGYYRDADAGVVNAGPFPPKVNQPTQYTIHWRIQNYATDVSKVRISAFLQSNTKFVRVVKSNIGSAPKYNAASGQIVWEIPNIAATRGVLGEPLEAVFQIENTPAVNQVDQVVPLLSKTEIAADDVFTGLRVAETAPPVSTAIPDDLTVAAIDHAVQP
jgi:hypothetical protein